MKKIALGSILVLLLLVAGFPYYMGITARQSFDKYIDYVNQQTPILKLKIADYKQGWFKSEANIDVTLIQKHRSGRKTPLSFNFKEVIHHGPILIDKGFKVGRAYFESKLTFSEKTLDKVRKKVKFEPMEPKIVSDMQLDLTGDYNGIFNISPFKMISKKREDMYFLWREFDIKGMLSSDFSKTNATLKWLGFEVTGKDSKFSMGPMTVDYELKKAHDHLWEGDVNVQQQDVTATSKGREVFDMKKVSLKSSTNIDDDFLNYDVFFNMSVFKAKDKTYGPMDMNVSVKNLDVKTLSRLQKNVEKANNPNLSASEKQMIMMALMPSLPNIITPKSQVNIDADFNIPDGKVEAKGFVKLDGNSNDQINMMTLQRSLVVDFEAKAPKKTILYFTRLEALKKAKRKQMKQAAYSHEGAPEGMAKPEPIDVKAEAAKMAMQQVQQWEQMGFLTPEGNAYKLKVAISGGRLVLNGRPMN